MFTRRQFTSGGAGFIAAALCRDRFARCDERPRLIERIDEAVDRAVVFLAGKQAADGAWRSEVYGPLKDGPSLTAFIAAILAKFADQFTVQPTLSKAASYLTSIDPQAAVITYPVYAAAGAVTALSRQSRGGAAARDRWLAVLRQQQLVEALGWSENDDSFGGWSFAHEPPLSIDGKPASPLAVPNLSATTFAIDALRAAGCSADDSAVQKAVIFVQRCQNWSDDESAHDSQFDDGGFFFLHGDPTRNKPGEAGVDDAGRTRYVSYGSTTADGLRALLACGLPIDHPRVQAARRWLIANFSAEKHPGCYPADREHLRPSLYFYFAASVAEALLTSRAKGDNCDATWASALSDVLVRRQQTDGSWVNPAVDVREDDPLVATPLCLSALFYCKTALRRVT
jgi:squalene-hopene/tetraprenyl-beta-curcumene cyclase